MALVENWFRHNELDGMMWESERQGPLNNTLGAHFGNFNGDSRIYCERMARRLAGSLSILKLATPGPDEELEKRALMRTRMELRGKNLSLGVALAGVVAIVLLVAINGARHSAGMPVYIFLIVAGVAVYALLAQPHPQHGSVTNDDFHGYRNRTARRSEN